MFKAISFFAFFLYSINSIGQHQPKWQYLFDGRSQQGWSILGMPANVKIRDSSIVLHMTPYTSRHAFVRTNKKYRNFIFEVQFRRDLDIDSGILFRSIDAPDTAFHDLYGYMVKIDPSQTRLWTGGVFLDFGNGLQWLYPLDKDENAKHAERKQGEWNTIRIEAIGDQIKVWLNDISTVYLMDDKYRKGYIAFKIHYLINEKEKADLEIAYREPRIITKHLSKYLRPSSVAIKDTRGLNEVKYFR